MPVYQYKCMLGHEFEAEKSIADRYNAVCPACGCTTEDQLEIQLQPVSGTIAHQDRVISEAQCAAEYGSDWRETEGSRRMMADEPKKLHSLPGKPARRKGKSFLNK